MFGIFFLRLKQHDINWDVELCNEKEKLNPSAIRENFLEHIRIYRDLMITNIYKRAQYLNLFKSLYNLRIIS